MKDRRLEWQLLITLLIASALFLWLGIYPKRVPSRDTETAPQTVENAPEATPPDYMPLSGRLVFSGSKKAITVGVPILEDKLVESGELVTLTLRNPTGGAQLGLRHTVLLTILDNDP